MADTPISKLVEAGTLIGDEPVIISQRSTSVTISAATISAQASDNSFNDSGSGFVTAGFQVGDYVNVSGFTGDTANNIYSGEITALTAGKMTIGGADGNVIVDDAAGETVVISKWVSRRLPLSSIQGGGGMSKEYAIAVGVAGGNSASSNATKGRIFIPVAPIIIDRVAFNFLTVAGATYKCVYGKLNSSNAITQIASSSTWVPSGAAQVYRSFDLPAFAVAENEIGFVALTRTDGGDTYALPIANATSNSPIWSSNFAATYQSFNLAKANPIVTDVVTPGTSGFSGDLFFEYS